MLTGPQLLRNWSARGGTHPLGHKGRLAAFLLALVALSACTDETAEPPEPEVTTTTTEEPSPVERVTTLRIGIAVNDASPTAAFDAEIETILRESMSLLDLDDSLAIELTTVSIESPGQAEGTVRSLIQNGISVIITGCDDATVPSVVEAATSNELLAVTGCVSLPRPAIERFDERIDPALFIDISSLADNARAIATYASDQGYESLGVITSTLFPDVDQTCANLKSEVGSSATTSDESEDATGNSTASSVTITAETTFTELVDAPTNVVADYLAEVGQTAETAPDAIVICALAPTVGDVTQALREADISLPIIVPWYADSQTWAAGTSNVVSLAPASRYGDDPETSTAALFDALTSTGQQPDAVEVITADTLAILIDAAVRSNSVGSVRLAETIRTDDAPVSGVSGQLRVGGESDFPVRRTYRVISVEDGEPAFTEVASSFDR